MLLQVKYDLVVQT